MFFEFYISTEIIKAKNILFCQSSCLSQAENGMEFSEVKQH
jgi:hypothetical protein